MSEWGVVDGDSLEVVLDPFTGSGTTGIAAVLGGWNFIGVERDPEFAQIARARLAHWSTREAA